MAKKKIKVLYFLDGSIATEEDKAAIGEFGANDQVCYRNAKFIHDGDAIEDFDLVAGAVPKAYQDAADEKGPPREHKRPKSSAAKVPAGSPVVPPEGAGEADKGKGATPKAPAPKPEAAKGWTPNA